MKERKGVFISYSQQDRQWLEALNVHLKFLEREYEFTIWEDSKIKPGTDWRAEITHAMNNAKVALLLVSAHFLSSDFIQEEELPRLLAAAEDEGALIFPIIVGHCMLDEFPAIAKFQALNPLSKPLKTMKESEVDSLFVEATKAIKNALLTPAPKKVQNSLVMLSLARICVLSVLLNHHLVEPGLQLTEIYRTTNLQSRRNVYSVAKEMEKSGLVIKKRIGKNTYWKISQRGKDVMEDVKKSYLFL